MEKEKLFYIPAEPAQHESETARSHGIGEPLADHEGEPFLSDRERKFNRISRDHCRSLEERNISSGIIWSYRHGKYDILYGSKSIKGQPTNGSDIKLTEDSNYINGYRADGLFDKTYVNTVMAASKFMNEHGLPTEFVREVRNLKGIKIDGKMADMENIKTILIKEYEEELKLSEPDENERQKKLDASTAYLKSADFSIIERDTQVNERVQDLSLADEANFRKIVAKVFKWVNQRNRLEEENKKLPAKKRKKYSAIGNIPALQLDPKKIEHVEYYFKYYLPNQMGQYLGIFHRLKLIHKFPTSHNWSLTGQLYDLDSVRGPSLLNPSKEDQYEDIETSTNVLANLFLGDLLDEEHKNREISYEDLTPLQKRIIALSKIEDNKENINRDYIIAALKKAAVCAQAD
ncbi:MAG: hypothetical protein WC745_03020, partial [Patescibacteria group bacterium]